MSEIDPFEFQYEKVRIATHEQQKSIRIVMTALNVNEKTSEKKCFILKFKKLFDA